jgi:hypothetical protein
MRSLPSPPSPAHPLDQRGHIEPAEGEQSQRGGRGARDGRVTRPRRNGDDAVVLQRCVLQANVSCAHLQQQSRVGSRGQGQRCFPDGLRALISRAAHHNQAAVGRSLSLKGDRGLQLQQSRAGSRARVQSASEEAGRLVSTTGKPPPPTTSSPPSSPSSPSSGRSSCEHERERTGWLTRRHEGEGQTFFPNNVFNITMCSFNRQVMVFSAGLLGDTEREKH